ncbi:MAG: 50S ribosomal protein L21e [Candidatus Brockarchaeota archaeon]|nr:50S ribosomal protein L21e [Candidatus Brockarchaeota archaeon]MBO3808294.1 50S ribosomal protein L21e [Candidatus Brockarchaeota archaeon]
MPQTSGRRIKTRSLLRKKVRERGIKPPSYLLQDYRPGDRVILKYDPSVHKGMPHRRFYGKIGTVIGKRGGAYVIQVVDGDKTKTLIARPEHLKRL